MSDLFEHLIARARESRASDLHLEPGMPATLRVEGHLESVGDPVDARVLAAAARRVVGSARWSELQRQRSFNATQTIAGTRCRVNIFCTARGVGFAIRLLAPFQQNLQDLNLHPDLGELTRYPTGLVLISGATGSGKSTTLAALIQEINNASARHVITIESPIEYVFKPKKALIRQREVGRDTPSFEQALVDVLREDPDVIVVGEMLAPETMRLTLNAAETGHLVFATMHAATPVEALHRLVSAFAPEIQSGVRAQLADTLRAVVCQRLTLHARAGCRVPECEVLIANDGVRGMLRKGDVFRINSAIDTGRDDGMWSFERYGRWIQGRTDISNQRWSSAAEPQPSLPGSTDIVADAPAFTPRAAPAAVAPADLAQDPHGVYDLDAEAARSGSAEVDDLISQLERAG